MTEINNTPETKETSIVPVSSETDALVEKEMAGQDEQIKAETKALVEAIKKRAQSEIDNAQTLTQDAYLNAVRSAREAIEQNKFERHYYNYICLDSHDYFSQSFRRFSSE